MLPRPLIIDCDPGVDDAIALLLAFASAAEFDLLGITTVAGNVPLALTQANARRICHLAQRTNVPVYAGCPRPLLRSLTTAEDIHGATGLQGTQLPEPAMPLQSQHAVAFLIEQLTTTSVPITLATLGPLTNLAVALIQCPAIAQNIDQVVMMGGALGCGNITPAAEFNIYVDPHAAKVVVDAGLPLIMIGLDVTHQVVTTPDRLAALEALGTPVGKAAAGMLRYYGQLDLERHGLAAPPLHDPCVLAYLLRPDLFSGRPMHLAIETEGTLCLGRTVANGHPTPAAPANATVIETANADGIYALLIERLRKL
ncbi:MULTISPECIES: nucleoside hydrolase [Cyanophyceae]|uniref:nucleoside hydrolase n=1 Tax=Cyanophyceae TaxID=3028117 RepID=UPI001688F8CC|nr:MULTISPECIES: nucleoside hydrolase [Cyanophyceae]MBD1916853.1 nucleoside hydrolase [Phormidium sp. FACHB-77]MBD2029484.1 nucleoside hydrolase [Phormidium sp. FACHB-322]MBD2052060.1 nucleoside hydrolase [Leptolyngbya sp. FACHB-60]